MQKEIMRIIELFKKYPNLLEDSNAQLQFSEECEELIAPKPILENFFNNSKVSTFLDKNRKKPLDNVIIDYDGRNYIRIMKLFIQHSNCRVDLKHVNPVGLTKLDKQKLIDAMNKDFHLRVYLPKNIIASKGKKIDKLIIMLNGLDELENFKMYDILGEFFADNNFGAILLPTPFHLNRRIEKKIFPSDRAKHGNELLFALNYLKSYKELNVLLAKIKGDDTNESDDDFGFYEEYFDGKNTEINLLGYSLGGLKMLGYFLKDFQAIDENNADDKIQIQLFKEKQKFHSCITINSGLDLPLAQIQNLNKKSDGREEKARKKDEWRKLLTEYHGTLLKSFSEQTFTGEEKELLELCELLYFPNDDNIKGWESRIHMAKSRILALTGGGDEIVDIHQIQKLSPSQPINQYILASADHHLGMITGDWAEDVPRAENAILYFIKHCQDTHYNEKEIEKRIKDILDFAINSGGLKNFTIDNFREAFYEEHILEVLNCLPGDKKSEFKKYYFLSKAFFPNFPQLICKIYPTPDNRH